MNVYSSSLKRVYFWRTYKNIFKSRLVIRVYSKVKWCTRDFFSSSSGSHFPLYNVAVIQRVWDQRPSLSAQMSWGHSKYTKLTGSPATCKCTKCKCTKLQVAGLPVNVAQLTGQPQPRDSLAAVLLPVYQEPIYTWQKVTDKTPF